jgi:hypothetical protein
MSPKRFLRFVAFISSFVIGATAVWRFSDHFVRTTRTTRAPMALDILPDLRRWQFLTFAEEVHPRIALVGDSMLLGEEGDKTVGSEVRRSFELLGFDPPLTALAWPALGPISDYCLADEIIAARPDLVALEVNLRGLQAGPLGPVGFPELAGYVRASRFVEAASLPLWDAGITFDRLLFYRAIVASGFERQWARLLNRQARMLRLRDMAEGKSLLERRFVLGATSYKRKIVPGRNRAQKSLVMENLRSALDGVAPDGARLRVLGATLRALRKGGIPVLVWVAPVNVEHLRSLGLSVARLDETIRSTREVAETAGAAFTDFHSLLPDAGFRDSGDHVTIEGPVDGSEILGGHLALAIIEALAGFSPSSPPSGSERDERALQ